uniref:Cathepsin L13 n=1 Tax=Dysdercus peruvianus TaxID=685034 RepID=A0A7S6TYX3_9HEMI|nr:cathepsin L13 [Dysdercus peruvianus]
MRWTFLIISCTIVASSALPSLLEEWASFKARHRKSYQSRGEEKSRFSVFLSNLRMIREHNSMFGKGLVSYDLKMNHLGDMLKNEISTLMNGLIGKGEQNTSDAVLFQSSAGETSLPDHVDWRAKGAVTRVKEQGTCGSCWAFSTTGSMEGQLFKKTGKLVSLSEQNLVDCATKEYGNNGCNGGYMTKAFRYIKENNGIDSEKDYPYEGKERSCRYQKPKVAGTLSGYGTVPYKNEEELKKAVATVGPISIAINSSPHTLLFYKSGVYTDKACTDSVNHGVLLVGYGTDNGQDYWLVKNSWGTKWGEEGYVRLARNSGNLCGVASLASYPIV